jgi:NO-binding membrane sensor protein with MHYT domain
MIFGTAIAFFLLQEHVSNRGVSLPLAVAVLGTALVASHYTGIGALTGRGLQLSWFLAAINIFVSIEVAVLFFWFVFRQRGVILTLAGSIALGFALAATHYLSIASTENLEAALASVPAAVTPISDRYLAWTATIMMYLICSICLCVFVIMQFREEME